MVKNFVSIAMKLLCGEQEMKGEDWFLEACGVPGFIRRNCAQFYKSILTVRGCRTTHGRAKGTKIRVPLLCPQTNEKKPQRHFDPVLVYYSKEKVNLLL